jgi:hypothetical protein
VPIVIAMVPQPPRNIEIESIDDYVSWISRLGVIQWFRGEAMDYGAKRT